MPNPVISTASNPKLLWPGVYTTWGQVYNQHEKEYPNLYEIRDSDKAYETGVQMTPFGPAPVKPQGQALAYQGQQQGILTNYQHVAYALGFAVTYEEKRDNLYAEVANRRAAGLAFSMTQTIELVSAFLYNNAFSTTYFTTGDGAALLSTAHTGALGGTYSNALSPAADLSEAALEDLTIQMMGATDDAGNLIAIMPKSLLVSRFDVYNAARILESVLQNDSSQNAINAIKALNMFPEGAKVNHYFTTPHAFFIRTDVMDGMTFFWRDQADFDNDNDFSTKNELNSSYMRFSVGCTDPHGLYGSNGP